MAGVWWEPLLALIKISNSLDPFMTESYHWKVAYRAMTTRQKNHLQVYYLQHKAGRNPWFILDTNKSIKLFRATANTVWPRSIWPDTAPIFHPVGPRCYILSLVTIISIYVHVYQRLQPYWPAFQKPIWIIYHFNVWYQSNLKKFIFLKPQSYHNIP